MTQYCVFSGKHLTFYRKLFIYSLLLIFLHNIQILNPVKKLDLDLHELQKPDQFPPEINADTQD